MVVNLGLIALLLSFLCAVYAAAAAVYGARARRPAWTASASSALFLTWPLLTLVGLTIMVALLTADYNLVYAYNTSSRAMPVYLRITSWWGGQAGSLTFWSWLMAAFGAAATLRQREQDDDLRSYAVAVIAITLAFFLSLSVFFENPFARWWQVGNAEPVAAVLRPAGAVPFLPADGRGLNPLLRHPGMIIHPPLLYTGFVGFVVPYAFAIAALLTGRADDRWIRLTRRWTLVAWLFLSLGLIVGGRWAYDVLGWGGYWGWDPVENAAFIPWLTGTAFLHSVMIQEKRGMFKVWNMILVILTYALVIFGTFLTRSGVLSSVHAFARSSIALPFFVFIAATFLGSLALLFRRWEALREDSQLEGWLSREAAFLLNNLFFIGILATVFWGTIFPLISELVTGQKVSVGPPFYQQTTGPQFLALLVLMGIGPLMAWRRASAQRLWKLLWTSLAGSLLTVAGLWLAGVRIPWALVGFWAAAFSGLTTLFEYGRGVLARRRAQGEPMWQALLNLVARNRRRYGGYVIHLGVTVMALGIVATQFYQEETQGALAQGESLALGPYTLTYTDLAEFPTEDGRQVARAVVQVHRDGAFVGELYPRRDYYVAQQQPMTIPGVRSSLADDFYVLLVSWEPVSAGRATFKVYLNPLVNFVWLGGLIFIIGTLVAAWPEPEPSPVRARTASRARPAAAD